MLACAREGLYSASVMTPEFYLASVRTQHNFNLLQAYLFAVPRQREEREGGRESERQRGRQTDTETDRQTDRDKKRGWREGVRETETDTDRQRME